MNRANIPQATKQDVFAHNKWAAEQKKRYLAIKAKQANRIDPTKLVSKQRKAQLEAEAKSLEIQRKKQEELVKWAAEAGKRFQEKQQEAEVQPVVNQHSVKKHADLECDFRAGSAEKRQQKAETQTLVESVITLCLVSE